MERAVAQHRGSLVITRAQAVAIAAGGVVGAALRWAILQHWPVSAGIPWPVLAINVGGSLLLGAALAEEWRHPRARLALHDAVGIGFCGGLTTFSTFAVEVATLLHNSHAADAIVYVTLSVVGSVLAVVAGAWSLRRVQALREPLEGMP